MQRHQGTGSRGPSQRQLRVGELLRAALSETLARGEVQDPVLENAIITVSEVRASPDLKNATAYIVPLGHDDPDAVVEALTRAKKFLRGTLARQVSLKYMPDLTFAADTTFDYADKVDNLLSSPEVARDLDGSASDGSED